jgi:hypothetical protein
MMSTRTDVYHVRLLLLIGDDHAKAKTNASHMRLLLRLCETIISNENGIEMSLVLLLLLLSGGGRDKAAKRKSCRWAL